MTHAREMLDAAPKRGEVDSVVLAETIDACADAALTCVACADACLAEEDPAPLRACIGSTPTAQTCAA